MKGRALGLDLRPGRRADRARLLQTKLPPPVSPPLEGLPEAHSLGPLNRSDLDPYGQRHKIGDAREIIFL
jgi:hypothetical protein